MSERIYVVQGKQTALQRTDLSKERFASEKEYQKFKSELKRKRKENTGWG